MARVMDVAWDGERRSEGLHRVCSGQAASVWLFGGGGGAVELEDEGREKPGMKKAVAEGKKDMGMRKRKGTARASIGRHGGGAWWCRREEDNRKSGV